MPTVTRFPPNLERDVRTTVLPDDDDTGDEHPWSGSAGACTSTASRQQPSNLGFFLMTSCSVSGVSERE